MTPPTATRSARPEIVTRQLKTPRAAWIERATSADHKTVAGMYIATALVFVALACTFFVLTRAQLLLPQNDLVKPEIFNRLMTGQVTTFVTLGIVPLALGLIGYIVPLQIGARGVALPRLNQLSYFLYLAGGVTILASFLYTAPDTGTAALPPLSDVVFSPSNGADAWIAGTGLTALGLTCFAINLVATVRTMRAPGMAWRRAPLFTWSSAVVGHILLLIGPVMVAALTMLEIDRHFDGVFFDSQEGGAPLLYEHFSYIFLTGIYLSVFLTAAGAISEILPTFARKPIFSRRAIATSFVLIAVFGLLAWMQNMYIAPLNEGWTIMAMAFGLALIVPIGVVFYNWIATIWGGTLEMRAATWYALGAIAMLSFGLAGELGYTVIPVGWGLDNTTASQADTFYVLVGGGIIGGFAALHYWFPKLSGRLLGEGLGKGALVAILLGLNLYVFGMFFAGLQGQPVDAYQYYENTGVDGYNLIASIGAFILVGGILAQLCNAAHSWNHGLLARGHDPWQGSTLEWYALSPPPAHNFDAVPDVRSAEPLHDIRESIELRQATAERPPAMAPAASPAPESPAETTTESESASSDRGDSPSVA